MAWSTERTWSRSKTLDGRSATCRVQGLSFNFFFLFFFSFFSGGQNLIFWGLNCFAIFVTFLLKISFFFLSRLGGYPLEASFLCFFQGGRFFSSVMFFFFFLKIHFLIFLNFISFCLFFFFGEEVGFLDFTIFS